MGIDYGRGLTNIDLETGIRYGIIPANLIHTGEFEFNYVCRCPQCGNEFEDMPEDLTCECGFTTEFEDNFFGDGPDSITYTKEGYQLVLDVDSNEIWVFKSPFKTRAGFCSPCAPGACYLTDRSDDAWAYCLGEDWFEDCKCPYDVTEV